MYHYLGCNTVKILKYTIQTNYMGIRFSSLYPHLNLITFKIKDFNKKLKSEYYQDTM